ncbi:MAG: hypothetical protein ACKVPJ_05615 [Chitinophagales bacterium]
MKRKTSTELKNQNRKLFAYSSSAAVFLACTNATEAQTLVYTNVDPDVILEAPNALYDLDLNNDGTTDFTLSATSAGSNIITSLGANVFYGINGVFINPENSNSIAGTSGSLTGFAYPYVLASSVNVGGGQLFLNASFQTLAYSFFASHDGVENVIAQYGLWLGGQTDKFIGLKMLIAGNSHYGWVRVNVDSSHKKMTVKDYAFESAPNTPIHTEIDVAIEDASQDIAAIYTFENSLFISFKDFSQLPGTVFLYEFSGREIFSETLQGTNNRIDLSFLPASAYVVRIQTAKAAVAGKVSVVK